MKFERKNDRFYIDGKPVTISKLGDLFEQYLSNLPEDSRRNGTQFLVTNFFFKEEQDQVNMGPESLSN